MTEKRFTVPKNYRCIQDNLTKEHYLCEDKTEAINLTYLLNELSDKNEQLKTKNFAYLQDIEVFKEQITHLKLDNNALIHLLENQSMIIQELHSKLLEYQIKEPIILKKEDLELMGKAISYYTHGRYAE